MIIVGPGNKYWACIVVDPSIVGNNKVEAVVKDSGGNTIETFALTRVGGTWLWCAERTAPSQEGIYAIDYRIVDANGNVVQELPEEALIVTTETIERDIARLESKIDEVLKWVKIRKA